MRRCFWLLICLLFVPSSTTLIRTLLASLNQRATTDRAAREVLEVADKDSNARQYVVERLLALIDKPVTDEVWLNAVRLAGRLRASQAVPSLQRAFPRVQLGRPAVTTLGAEVA